MTDPICFYRISSNVQESNAYCSHPKVHFPNQRIVAGACHSCRFCSPGEIAGITQNMPRYVHNNKETDRCYFACQSTNAQVFRCRHPLHLQATATSCKSCLDFERTASESKSLRWSVGITTCPRRIETLSATVVSLVRAGWNESDMQLFAEPPFEDISKQLRVTYRGTRMGAFPNWYVSLTELVLANSGADYFFMCQDDVAFCIDVKSYLEDCISVLPPCAFLSLYCGTLQRRPQMARGFFERSAGEPLYGALAIVISAPVARMLTDPPPAARHRRSENGLFGIDRFLSEWADELALPAFVHYPSLVAHTGHQSATMWGQDLTSTCRQSDNFIGVNVSPRYLLPSSCTR